MPTTVTVSNPSSIRVSVPKIVPTFGRLVDLLDVDRSLLADGTTLTYDAANNKFVFVTGSSTLAIAAYNAANNAQNIANSAAANTGAIGPAFDKANTANLLAYQANINATAAFAYANGVGSNLTLAWATANVGFTQANGVSSNLTLAWGTANAGFSFANGVASNLTTAWGTANASFSFANGVSSNLTLAWGTANAAFSFANGVSSNAILAWGQANSACTNLAIAWGTANAAFTQGNTANGLASQAFDRANVANGVGAQAFGKANAAFNVYVTGTNTTYNWTIAGNASINSNSTSNLLKLVSGIGITLFTDGPNNALLITDSGAFGFANGVSSNLTLAWGTANGAFTQGNTANSLASQAFDRANTANGLASQAFDRANTANGLASIVFGVANGVATNTASAWNKANTPNAFANVFVTNTDVNYSWTLGGNIAVLGNASANVLRLISGNNVTIYADAQNNAIRINAAGGGSGTGGVSNAFANIYFTNTDAGYVWTVAGNAGFTANATSNVIKFISGAGIAISYDTQNSAVRINSTVTGSGGGFSNLYATATDVGYTWTAAGNGGFTTSGSQLIKIVAGVGVEIDFDSQNNAIRFVSVSSGTANSGIITANAAFDRANIANNLASIAYDRANTANGLASQAFDRANTANGLASQAFDRANTANGVAAQAFGKANAAFNVYVTGTNVSYNWTIAGNASINSNSTSNLLKFVPGIGITLFFDQPNNAILFTDSGAFGFANGIASNLTIAWGTANGAFTQGNTANGLASQAFDRANTSNGLASAAFDRANTANGLASQAFDRANTANGLASQVFGVSNAAFLKANNANAWTNVTISQTDVGYSWTTAGNVGVAANNTANVIKLISGSGIALYGDPGNSAIRINSTATGGASNAYANVYVTNTDVGYTWTVAGNNGFVANSTANTIKFVSGGGVAIFYDSQNNAIRINSTATGTSSGGATFVIVQDSAPAATNANTLWWQSNTGVLKIYYTDANGSRWVDASPAGGAAGSTGSVWTEVEVAFGNEPIYANSFNIIDSRIYSSNNVVAVQSGRAASGRANDEVEMDSFICSTNPSNGFFNLTVTAVPGPVVGNYRFMYTWS